MNVNNLTVNKSRKLISSASSKIGFDERKLLTLALANVDSPNPQPEKSYLITVASFQDAYSMDRNHASERLKAAAENLMQNPIVIRMYNPITKEVDVEQHHWFETLRYSEGKDHTIKHVEVKFSEFVKPHIYSLDGNYISCKFQYLAGLTLNMSHQLYDWLREKICLDRLKNKKQNSFTLIKDLEWIRTITLVGNKYKSFKDFRVYVLEPAISEINQSTDLTVALSTVSQGRKVIKVRFDFVEEKEAKIIKPLRPSLPIRSHAKKGTHDYGEWCKKCISLLESYRTQLKEYDQTLELKKTDLKRLAEYHSAIGDKAKASFYKNKVNEIEAVKTKKQEIIVTLDNIEEHKQKIIDAAISAMKSLYSANGKEREEMTEAEKNAFDLISQEYMQQFISNTIDNTVEEERKKL